MRLLPFLALVPLLLATEEAAVRGVVVDESGAPLAGVRYAASGWEELRDGEWTSVFYTGLPRPAWTGPDGRFELSGREGQRQDVDFHLPGRAPSFVLGADPGSELRVVMRRGADVAGRVVQVGPEGERGIEHARLELTRPNPRGIWFQAELSTGPDGRFELPGFLAPEATAGDGRSGGLAWELVCNGARLELAAEPGEAVDDLRVELRLSRGR